MSSIKFVGKRSSFLFKTFVNHRNQTTLVSIIFWILAISNALLQNTLSEAVLSSSFKISISHMLKVGFILFVLVNISWISCFFRFLYSFFVFSKWFWSNVCKSKLSLYFSPANKSFFIVSFVFAPLKQNIS